MESKEANQEAQRVNESGMGLLEFAASDHSTASDTESHAECPDTELYAEWCPAADEGEKAIDRCAITAAYDHPADTDPELDRELSA
jgi:hypothetical protein